METDTDLMIPETPLATAANVRVGRHRIVFISLFLLGLAASYNGVAIDKEWTYVQARTALICGHALPPCLAATFLLAQVGMGRLVLRMIRSADASLQQLLVSTRGVLYLVTGLYVSGLLLTVTTVVAGGFSQIALVGYCAVVSIAAIAGFYRPGSARLGAFQTTALTSAFTFMAAAVAALLFFSPFAVRALLPTIEWDTAAYHLPLAKLYAERGLWWSDPYFPEYHSPGITHVLFMAPLRLAGEQAVLWLNVLSVACAMLGVFALAAELAGRKSAGWWAAGVLGAMGLFWQVGFGARIDVSLSLYVVCAALACIVWYRHGECIAFPAIAGAAMGLACGTKYTGLLAAAALTAAWLAAALYARIIRQAPPKRFWPPVIAVLTLCLPAGFWYVRNFALLGNPFFPRGSGAIYRDSAGVARPLAPALESARAKTIFADAHLQLDKPPTRPPPESMLRIWDVLLHPDRYGRQPYHGLSPLVLLGLLAPLSPMVRRRPAAMLVWGMGMMICIPVAMRIHLVRYVMPGIALFCALAGVVLAGMRWKFLAIGFGWILGVGLLDNAVMESFHLWRLNAPLWVSGQESRAEWDRRVGLNGHMLALFPEWYINDWIAYHKLPREGTVFMVGHATGWPLRRPYLPDQTRQARRWLAEVANASGDHDAIERSLRAKGVDLLLIDRGYQTWVSLTAPIRHRPYLGFAAATVDNFVHDRMKVIYEIGGVTIATWPEQADRAGPPMRGGD